MHVFPPSVLVTFLVTFTSAEVEVGVDSQGLGVRDRSVDGLISNDHVLFQADVVSKTACASSCLKRDGCVAFSTTPVNPVSKMLTCRGHDSQSLSQTSMVAVPGSKTYFVKKQEVGGSGWLERPCSSDSDCPSTVANVVCYPSASQCLCQPGYYYSHSRDECITHCALQNLTAKFLRYPNRYIPSHNVHTLYDSPSIEHCKKHCLGLSECRTIDMPLPTCYPAIVTALELGTTLSISSTNQGHFQRTCL